jgi:gas vesicle protein
MNLDDSADAVTDHRIALMQKWAADPKLMAQMGVLQDDTGDHLSNAHLDVRIPAIEKLRAVSRLVPKRNSTAVMHTGAADEHKHSIAANDKKKKKKNKTAASVQATVHNQLKTMSQQEKIFAYKLLMETHGIHTTEHTSKHQKSQNHALQVIHENELQSFVDGLKQQMKKYDTLSQGSFQIMAALVDEIPSDLSDYVSKATSSIMKVLKAGQALKSSQFQTVFNDIKPLHEYVTDKSPHKRISFNFAHPRFAYGPQTSSTMEIGFLAYAIVGMTYDYWNRNASKATKKTEHFKEVKKLNNRLHSTYTSIKKKNDRLEHSGLTTEKSSYTIKNPLLRSDANLELNQHANIGDSTISLAHPFSE